MRRRRVTREWRRGSVESTRKKGGISRYKVLGFIILLVAAFFVGRGFKGGDTAPEEPVASECYSLDVGGGLSGDNPVSEVLSGNVLSIPVADPIVLDENVVDEADIAQDTTTVEVSKTARETALTPVNDTHGTGTATSELVSGTFQHLIVATLPDPPEGYFYEGWLIRSKPFDFFSTGRLIQHADDLKWYLVWTDVEDRRDYNKVIVTLEEDDGDEAPADHVLEGVFR